MVNPWYRGAGGSELGTTADNGKIKGRSWKLLSWLQGDDVGHNGESMGGHRSEEMDRGRRVVTIARKSYAL